MFLNFSQLKWKKKKKKAWCYENCIDANFKFVNKMLNLMPLWEYWHEVGLTPYFMLGRIETPCCFSSLKNTHASTKDVQILVEL